MNQNRPSSNTIAIQSVSDIQARALMAAAVIERVYLSYRDRQMFTLLKHAVRAAEQSWTHDILRKISPNEADLLRDPSVNAKIRFRFAGREFPPVILFKIYLVSNGTKYISGRRTIRPATDAAVDACRLMGHRKFYDQMIIDACQFEQDKITDIIDVTTVKDYMQYLSNLDEMPSYLGGKENYWRHLSLEALPRQNIMYDIVEYLKSKSPSTRLRSEMPILMSRPVTQEIQLEQVRAISRLPTPPPSTFTIHLPTGRPHFSSGPITQRRSSQSKKRVAKMKRMYGMEPKSDDKDLVVRPTSSLPRQNSPINDMSYPGTTSREIPSDRSVSVRKIKVTDAEPEDHEARELYEWTRDLNIDDINKGIFPSQSEPSDVTSRSVSYSSQTKRIYAL